MIDSLIEFAHLNVATATEIPYFVVALKIFAGIVVGCVIGVERSMHGRPVGIRTYCLVGLASVAVVQVIVHAPIWLAGADTDVITVDTTRIMRAVIAGISFLCAGVVYRVGFSIQGLTTAASVWATAIIGLILGSGLFFIAGVATLLVVIILSLLQYMEKMIPSKAYARLSVVFERNGNLTRECFFSMLKDCQIEPIGTINHQTLNDGLDSEITVTVRSHLPASFSRFAQSLRECPDFKSYKLHFTRK